MYPGEERFTSVSASAPPGTLDSRVAGLRFVAGLACLAVPTMEWGAQLVASWLGTPGVIEISRLGEPTSYHNLPYGILGYCLPGVLLLLLGICLSLIVGRSWLSMSFVGVSALLGAGTASLGILPNLPDSQWLNLWREAARAVFLWALPLSTILVGGALLWSGQRGQAYFSIAFGFAAAGAAFAIEVIDYTRGIPLLIATPWYVGTAAWLLQPVAANRWRESRVVTTPLIAVRLLAVVAVVAIAALDILVLRSIDHNRRAEAAAIAQVDGHTQLATLDQGGLKRHFRVYRPNRIARSPGLVIVLHGAYGNGLQAEAGTAFDVQARRLGWIAVYPDGYSDGWDAHGCCHHQGVDDVAFIAALIDEIEAADQIDPNRVFVTGISRGGMMSYRLGCELASRIAAIAPVAGNMATWAGSARKTGCIPVRPVSVLAIQGTADARVPFQGGSVSSQPADAGQIEVYASFSDVIGVWRDIDGCATSSSTSVMGPTTTTIWRCGGGSVVATKVIAGGGHDWPIGPNRFSPNGTHQAFDASAVIADFFAAHARGMNHAR